MSALTMSAAAMEMAAKYICNHHCGRCPMLIVQFPCPAECSLDTLAWQCWISYFHTMAERAGEDPETRPPSRSRQTAAENL